MKERPIIMAAESVRAILAGRKRQMRRAVKPQPRHMNGIVPMWGVSPPPDPVEFGEKWCWREAGPDYPDDSSDDRRCPYGVPGDRLWVKETYIVGHADGHGGWSVLRPSGASDQDGRVFYRASFREPPPHSAGALPWRTSLFMPRWASRLTLEVTGVRVERLQDISEEDAKAEGVERDTEPCDHRRFTCDEVNCAGSTYRSTFWDRWDAINAKRAPWSSNPWVWVVEFRLLEREERAA